MLFVTLGKAKAASTAKQRIARRAGWQYPSGVRVLGEYWLLTAEPATLILISESEEAGSILSAIAEWDDLFDLTVVPAMTAEQGLELAKQMASA